MNKKGTCVIMKNGHLLFQHLWIAKAGGDQLNWWIKQVSVSKNKSS